MRRTTIQRKERRGRTGARQRKKIDGKGRMLGKENCTRGRKLRKRTSAKGEKNRGGSEKGMEGRENKRKENDE